MRKELSCTTSAGRFCGSGSAMQMSGSNAAAPVRMPRAGKGFTGASVEEAFGRGENFLRGTMVGRRSQLDKLRGCATQNGAASTSR